MLQPNDQFPSITITPPDGAPLELPDAVGMLSASCCSFGVLGALIATPSSGLSSEPRTSSQSST
jgi:hypothetical protein